MVQKHEKDLDLHWDSALCQDPDYHPKDPDPTFRIPNDQKDLDPTPGSQIRPASRIDAVAS